MVALSVAVAEEIVAEKKTEKRGVYGSSYGYGGYDGYNSLNAYNSLNGYNGLNGYSNGYSAGGYSQPLGEKSKFIEISISASGEDKLFQIWVEKTKQLTNTVPEHEK